MDIRHHIIQRHLEDIPIQTIIGRTPFKYFLSLGKYLLILGGLWVIYLLIGKTVASEYTSRFFGIAGIVTYIFFVIDFLNQYLDAVILTNEGLIIFKREGLLTYKTDHLDRKHIQTISDAQSGLIDIIFNKGDLIIHLEDGIVFTFEDVEKPKQQAKLLGDYKAKHSFVREEVRRQDQAIKDQKFSLLVETLGEVITEYMDKKQDHSETQ